jgi:hypothetical protein
MSASQSTATTAPNYGPVSLASLYPQSSTVQQLSPSGTNGAWLVYLGIDALNPPGGPGVYIVSGITQPLKANSTYNSDVGWIVGIIVVHPRCVYVHEIQSNYSGSAIGIIQSGGSVQNLGSVSAFSAGAGWLCLTIGGGTDSTRVWGAYMSKISSA